MNANSIITDDMTLEEKLQAIENAMSDAMEQAKQAAVQAGRFGWGDVESIADFLATGQRDDRRVVADEASSTQPGTGGWAGFTTMGAAR